MIIFLLFAALLSFEAVCSLNTIYAASRSKTPWRYTAWTDATFISWWSKLKWGVFVLAAIWYVVMASAAVLAGEDWFIGFLDFWLYTRIPAWLLLTARAKANKLTDLVKNGLVDPNQVAQCVGARGAQDIDPSIFKEPVRGLGGYPRDFDGDALLSGDDADVEPKL